MNMNEFPIPCKDPEAIRPAKLAHVVFRCQRFEEMIEYYTNLLGAQINFRNQMLCFITFDDEHHRVALLNMPNASDHQRESAGIDHVAFTYASLADLIATYERLKARGVRPHWCINHGPTTSFYYLDPDGNQIELQIDHFATLEELAEWFANGSFQANPMGVEFDPDTLTERFHAGVPVSELIQQGSAPNSSFRVRGD